MMISLSKENPTGDAAFHAEYARQYAEMQCLFDQFDPHRNETLDNFEKELNDRFVIPILQGKKELIMQIFQDGVGRSGKTSLNKKLKEAGFFIFSTGYFYRAATLYAIEEGFDKDNPSVQKKFASKLQDLSFLLISESNPENNQEKLYVVIKERNKELYKFSVDSDLNQPAVTNKISYIGGLESVAKKLDAEVIKMLQQHRLIAIDSRDNYLRKTSAEAALAMQALAGGELETVVAYFYVCADLVERSRREAARKPEKKVEDIAKDLERRDREDAERQIGRLLLPDVAAAGVQFKYDYYLDTTKLNITEGQLLLLAAIYARFSPEVGLPILQNLEKYFKDRETFYHKHIAEQQQETLVNEQDFNQLGIDATVAFA